MSEPNEYEPRVGHFDGRMIMQWLELQGDITSPGVGISRLRACFPFGHVFDAARAEQAERERLAAYLFGGAEHPRGIR